ncbi:hypothetical protein BJ322DRAFT_1064726 [Thelephora terrestris]|uniref:Uncharacterized protein n=1 Tax=Thelephora terrestris TaxID=56493 RepID=A0A9P6L5M8_9AGAM|nr:hypothetical protein BJ322DRAFT_1064726 [Thelephora terrestris]
MSISVTGFTQSSFPSPIYALLGFRSMVYATVCFVAILVFAYFTNPSESSFRAYLAEQSFRRHLTHLDDESSDKDPDFPGAHYASRRNVTRGPNTDSARSRVHFANRASVILRTPLLAYRNLVFFTISFVVPPTESDAKSPDPDLPVSDIWFVGAFGGWWRGGPLYSWWVDAVARSRDEEGVSSGVLSVKTLDNLNEYDGVSVLPFSSFEAKKARSSPPRLRNPRSEPSVCVQRVQKALPSRSTTPPPLPATASLPLHNVQQSTKISVPQPFHPPALNSVATSSSSPPKSFDQSPVIADLLTRISSTKAGVQDLRSQIADFRAHSSQQREILTRELDAHRERKRGEELTRNELKSRTKSLEDSKRGAETAKRDAERKLKSAEARRDEVARKITHLRNEITKWRSKLGDDHELVANIRSGGSCNHGKGERTYLEEELQRRKAEITVAENVISALTVRANELEDEATDGRERLKVVLENARQASVSRHSEQDRVLNSPTDLSMSDRGDDLPWPPAQTSAINTSDQPTASRFSVSDDEISPHPSANFAPFDDLTSLVVADAEMPQSTFLIPSGLISSLPDATSDMDLSRSFKADNDPFIIKPNRPTTTLRRSSGADAHEAMNATTPRFVDDSPFEHAIGNGYSGGRIFGNFDPGFRPPLREESHLDQQRAKLRTTVPDQVSVLDPFSSVPNLVDPPRDFEVTAAPRRWFSVKEKKTLNPEAEAFNLPSTKPFFKPTVPAFFDALNPSKSGLASSMGSDGPSRSTTESVAHSTFFSKAFAPSPAERAALGAGRFHTSLEKLPSLSDVPGSLHTSPILSHTTPPIIQVPVVPGSSFTKSMSWLNSLPRRKPKFSPWDDEEH